MPQTLKGNRQFDAYAQGKSKDFQGKWFYKKRKKILQGAKNATCKMKDQIWLKNKQKCMKIIGNYRNILGAYRKL